MQVMKHFAETVALGTKGKLDEEDELGPSLIHVSLSSTHLKLLANPL
jgi:hypothetical protein